MSNCRFSKYFRKSSRKIRAEENRVKNYINTESQDVSHSKNPVRLAVGSHKQSIIPNFIGSESQIHEECAVNSLMESCFRPSNTGIDTNVHTEGFPCILSSDNYSSRIEVNPGNNHVSDVQGCVTSELKSDNCDSIFNADKCKINSLKSSSLMLRRRPGKIYRQKLAEKCKGKKSHYFSNKTIDKHKWLPPRSPYCLIQEDLYHSSWQLLIATIFLTKTQAKKAVPQILKFLERWPTPQALLAAEQEEIVEYLRPLGIQHVRSTSIRKFTAEFLEKQWTYPEELYGIGKYGNDSYRIFCVNEWRHVQPDDNKLNLYRNWLMEHAEQLGI